MSTLCRALAAVGIVFGIAVACFGQATSAPPPGEPQTPSCRTAMLVIDVQRGFLLGRSLTADGAPVQEKAAGIVSIARSNGVPVIFVKDISLRGEFTDAQLEIAPPLAILDGERLIEKEHPDSFEETPLLGLLQSMGVTTLLITGLSSTGCVSATVAGAVENGFDVIIVADAHSACDWGSGARRQNLIWAESGLPVLLSTEIDFAALCAPSIPNAGG